MKSRYLAFASKLRGLQQRENYYRNPEIQTSSAGFEVRTDASLVCRIEWTDIREIVACKIDLGTIDTIRIGFRIADEDDWLEVDEEWVGYKDLVGELKQRFEIDEGWWRKVALPAFATNRTVLWQEPST